MSDISLCMIVKDEEDTLFECLSSVADLVDEIIIVDTGSTDSTREIAAKFTDKVFDFLWIDDFSAARNFAFSKGSCTYLMWLDADDIIEKSQHDAFLKLKNSLGMSVDGVYMKYHVGFDGAGRPTFSYFRERIVRRDKNPIWVEPIHEVIEVSGNLIFSEVAVTHNKIKDNPPKRNLKIFEKQLKAGNKLSPRLQYYYGRELMYNDYPKKAVKVFEKFLDEGRGWVENNISCCLDIANCYQKMYQPKKALESCFRSFFYAPPRGEALCQIAKIFAEQNNSELSAYWYLLALNTPMPEQSLGFVEQDFYGYVPAIELCVLHDKMENFEMAKFYNEKAGTFKPDDPAYLHNLEYFNTSK